MNARAAVDVTGLHPISEAEFRALRDLIFSETGISLSDAKRQLVSARLSRRLRTHRLARFSDYYDLVCTPEGRARELQALINCVTTNKTSFFREPHHFELLREAVLEPLLAHARRGGPRRLRLWCAAASTGEEPWSLAMCVHNALSGERGWDARILASDIDTEVLQEAERGVYPDERVRDVPKELRAGAFDDGPEPGVRTVAEALRRLLTFRRINLVAPQWPIQTRFHAIFCRNVSIYFDRPTQDVLFRRMADLLEPGGLLVVGHAESLHWLTDILEPAGPTAYRVRAAAGSERTTVRAESSRGPALRAERPTNRAERPTVQAESSRGPAPDPAPGRIIVGEVFASAKGGVARTTLGSCVSVCLYDPVLKAGGMNHFLLPDGDGADGLFPRYGVHAMELLINELMHLGAERGRLVAKMFGGAEVLRNVGQPVGARNVAFTRTFLERERIPLASECVGGNVGMEVRFETATGRAFVRRLPGADAALGQQERQFAQRLGHARPAPEVELFGVTP